MLLPSPPPAVIKEAIIVAFLYGVSSYLVHEPLQPIIQSMELPVTFVSQFFLTMVLWLLLWYSGAKP